MKNIALRKLIQNIIQERYNQIFDEAAAMIDEERLTIPETVAKIKKRENCISSHLFGEGFRMGGSLQGLYDFYVVVSYEVPIYIWKNGKWYENKDNYIYNDKEVENYIIHRDAVRPTENTIKLSMEEMKHMLHNAMKNAGMTELKHSLSHPGLKNE